MPASSASSPRRDGRQRRELAHLQHRGVAEGEAGRDLPGRGHERHVPRRDQRAHAHRMEQRVVQVRGRRVGVAVDARAHLGEVVEVVGRARHQLLAGLRDDLAAVVGLGLRDLGHVRRDQVAQLADQLGALRRGHAGPLREGFLGGGDRGVHFGFAARGDFGQHFLRGGIHGLEIVAAGDRLAVDEVIDSHDVTCESARPAMVLTSAPMPLDLGHDDVAGPAVDHAIGRAGQDQVAGRSVMKLLKYSMRKGTSKIMSLRVARLRDACR